MNLPITTTNRLIPFWVLRRYLQSRSDIDSVEQFGAQDDACIKFRSGQLICSVDRVMGALQFFVEEGPVDSYAEEFLASVAKEIDSHPIWCTLKGLMG